MIGAMHQTRAQSIARVEKIKIQSEALGQERELLIYTPVEYDARVLEQFDVIYVFDSQNRAFLDQTSATVSFLSDGTQPYIIVGIAANTDYSSDYLRNNDLLPVLKTEKSKAAFAPYAGNIDNFLKYVRDEVLPYVETNYRTSQNNLAVGHSLSASFILHAMVQQPNLFDNYIAISPNLAYEDELMSKALTTFDYNQLNTPTYIYLSHANEGINNWQDWVPAREKAYTFFNALASDHVLFHQAEFPDYNHYSTFPLSLREGLSYYFDEVVPMQKEELSEEKYEVTLRVKVLGENEEVYVAGNQSALGDWDPGRVKMKKVAPFEREITVSLSGPAEFKFTRGSWETEAEVVGTFRNIRIDPSSKAVFEFEIESYFDYVY